MTRFTPIATRFTTNRRTLFRIVFPQENAGFAYCEVPVKKATFTLETA
jgi:hypothetical protein